MTATPTPFITWSPCGDTDGIHRVIEALFAFIPYTRESDPFENYFQAVLWLVFTLLNRYVHTEVRQARGRVDCVVETRAHVYVIEFMRDGTANEALAQITRGDTPRPLRPTRASCTSLAAPLTRGRAF